MYSEWRKLEFEVLRGTFPSLLLLNRPFSASPQATDARELLVSPIKTDTGLGYAVISFKYRA